MSALVYTVFASREDARAVAAHLLDERLIACANVIGQVEALFEWDGERGSGEEVAVLFKTHADRLDAAVARLEELHPYDTPAILGWPTPVSGSATRDWLAGLAS
ncbi:divalent-cation tolerance protein CutA [Alteriqipengyuania lutimaris]|uniref:Divalent-cation tolerance protein CutA n=1 Tax=Alteriqipengyuania lutimaris TaxID=1538146 RepID=A0A395LIR9_9SPHN|nr:divalent-cation tolerance protein CutA [Alteriqipengyuania lutimaris]MBB3034301.1 periplasmic divalent cation tolerance protein [Alteriqipengyuania lutimaris]RDS76792.1 divalent-cation tolerance protein CutA [Alteriqipengyuania lutimaris]